MRTRWRFFSGLDGRWGVRVHVFRRAGGKWRLISQLLVPAVHEARPMAVLGLIDAVAQGMPSVLTVAELRGAARGKGVVW